MPSHLILALILSLTVWHPDETIRRYGGADHTWMLQSHLGRPVAFDATLAFPRRNIVNGSGPCNHFNTTNTTPYPWFKTGPIAATKRACPNLADESAFFKALEEATIAVIEGDTLTLSNENRTLLTFKAAE